MERESVRKRVLVRESVGKGGFGLGTGSLKLIPSVFSVEFKRFSIEIDQKSRGDTIIITEISRM